MHRRPLRRRGVVSDPLAGFRDDRRLRKHGRALAPGNGGSTETAAHNRRPHGDGQVGTAPSPSDQLRGRIDVRKEKLRSEELHKSALQRQLDGCLELSQQEARALRREHDEVDAKWQGALDTFHVRMEDMIAEFQEKDEGGKEHHSELQKRMDDFEEMAQIFEEKVSRRVITVERRSRANTPHLETLEERCAKVIDRFNARAAKLQQVMRVLHDDAQCLQTHLTTPMADRGPPPGLLACPLGCSRIAMSAHFRRRRRT